MDSQSASKPKKFRSNYTLLLSVWNRSLTKAEYAKESAIINKIKKLGFTEQDILAAWNYYTGKGEKIKSYGFFLWKQGKLIKDILHFVKMTKKEEEKLLIDSTQDFRTETPIKKKISTNDFLNGEGDFK